MLSPMSAVPTNECPVMPGRSVTTQVNGDRSGVGGRGWMAVGAVSSPPVPGRTPVVGVWDVRVGAGLSETPQKLAPADVR
jgi:hypothetical protein